MQRGGGSKDTWMLADGTVNDFSLLPAGGFDVQLTRGGGDLPSRAADNLFWLGRYAERADGIARLLRCIAARQVQRACVQWLKLPPPGSRQSNVNGSLDCRNSSKPSTSSVATVRGGRPPQHRQRTQGREETR